MIIVEGPDGAGKSTLCRNLVGSGVATKVLDSPRVAAKGDIDRMKYETRRYLKRSKEDVVVDRLLFSELVYGPILRGRSAFSTLEALNLEHEIIWNKVIVIFCLPNSLIFKESEPQFLIDKMPLMVEKYRECANELILHYSCSTKYNWQEPDSYSNLLKFIKERS